MAAVVQTECSSWEGGVLLLGRLRDDELGGSVVVIILRVDDVLGRMLLLLIMGFGFFCFCPSKLRWDERSDGDGGR